MSDSSKESHMTKGAGMDDSSKESHMTKPERLNYRFIQFMEQPLNMIVQEYFSKQRFPELNKSISTNFYALDAIGIPIRKLEEETTGIFGWKRIGDLFYHHLVKEDLIGVINTEDLRIQTIAEIRIRYKTAFLKTTPMKRMLMSLYPELFE